MSASSTTPSSAQNSHKKPVVIITIGMAGSGKTTFVQRINSYLRSTSTPAVKSPPAKEDPTSKNEPSGGSSADASQPGPSTKPGAPPSSTSPPEPRAPYILNLDPAVTYMPFDANIDIRDTIDYAEVMKQLSQIRFTVVCISLVHSKCRRSTDRSQKEEGGSRTTQRRNSMIA